MFSRPVDVARRGRRGFATRDSICPRWASMGAHTLPTVTLVPPSAAGACPCRCASCGVHACTCIFPAVAAGHALHGAAPWPALVLENVLAGIPAGAGGGDSAVGRDHGGNLVDSLRGARDVWNVDPVAGKTNHLGVVFALLAATLFLQGGGPSRVAWCSRLSDFPAHPLLAAARDLVAGVTWPWRWPGLCSRRRWCSRWRGALVARAANPAQLQALLPPLRALGSWWWMALVLDRILLVLAHAMP